MVSSWLPLTMPLFAYSLSSVKFASPSFDVPMFEQVVRRFSLTLFNFCQSTFEIGRYVHLAGDFNGALQVLLLVLRTACDITSSSLGGCLKRGLATLYYAIKSKNRCASLSD
jgi:hypothetical protein